VVTEASSPTAGWAWAVDARRRAVEGSGIGEVLAEYPKDAKKAFGLGSFVRFMG